MRQRLVHAASIDGFGFLPFRVNDPAGNHQLHAFFDAQVQVIQVLLGHHEQEATCRVWRCRDEDVDAIVVCQVPNLTGRRAGHEADDPYPAARILDEDDFFEVRLAAGQQRFKQLPGAEVHGARHRDLLHDAVAQPQDSPAQEGTARDARDQQDGHDGNQPRAGEIQEFQIDALALQPATDVGKPTRVLRPWME